MLQCHEDPTHLGSYVASWLALVQYPPLALCQHWPLRVWWRPNHSHPPSNQLEVPQLQCPVFPGTFGALPLVCPRFPLFLRLIYRKKRDLSAWTPSFCGRGSASRNCNDSSSRWRICRGTIPRSRRRKGYNIIISVQHNLLPPRHVLRDDAPGQSVLLQQLVEQQHLVIRERRLVHGGVQLIAPSEASQMTT
jgi:hypothetical protein